MSSFSSPDSIVERIQQIQQPLPNSVRLIAVTKQVSVEAMRVAYAAGVRDFGESRVQEAAEKQVALQDLADVTWHFIGHLQSNKVQKALTQFEWIHSIDSLKLAERVDRLAEALPQKPKVCLQVKILPDPSKHGWSVTELLNDLPSLDRLTNLDIRGLMTIPPADLADAEVFKVFQQTDDLANKIQQQGWKNIHLQELSMGMSEDYPLAIQAGATMIRLGRILFGERAKPTIVD
jgi:PLP dependent protein